MCERFSSGKENDGLAVQARQSRNCTEAISSGEIESDDFVLSYTIEPVMWPKAQTPRLLKLYTIIWNKHLQEMPVSVVIFADRRHRVRCAEQMFAANDDIAAWRDRKVKRTKFRIPHLP